MGASPTFSSTNPKKINAFRQQPLSSELQWVYQEVGADVSVVPLPSHPTDPCPGGNSPKNESAFIGVYRRNRTFPRSSWVNPLKIMMERIANLKDYFPQAETLWDFMLTAEPEWAFISALRLLISLHTKDKHHVEAFLGDREPLLMEARLLASRVCCGKENVYDIFVQAAECNINPDRVRTLCQ